MNTKVENIERQLNVVRLRPRPKLPSEYRRQLHAERDKRRNGAAVADIAERLERLSETIAHERRAIPFEVFKEGSFEEDSLVTSVTEGLEVTAVNGRR